MGEREATTIGELIKGGEGEVKTGPFGTVLKASEYSPTTPGVPLISVREVGYGRLELHPQTPRVPREVTQRLPEFILREGDIVFGRKGAVDRSAYVTAHQQGWFLGSDGIRLRIERRDCDRRFISYQLQAPTIRRWILRNATGTTMPSLNQSVIGRIPIRFPPLRTQRRIAVLLSSFDDKIELNREMNGTLEATAQAIFRSWFVDFDPVVAKADGRKPFGLSDDLAALFPDRFVDSELGVIPEGWKVGKLEAVSRVSSGKRPPAKVRTAKSSHQVPVYGGAGIMAFAKKPLYTCSIIVTGRVGTLGQVHRVTRPSWRSDNTIVLDPSWPWFEFTYFQLQEHDLLALNRGSTQPLIAQRDLRELIICIPAIEVINKYREVCEPILAMIDANLAETETLAGLRDLLLPKLLSGEIRVGEAEADIEAAGV